MAKHWLVLVTRDITETTQVVVEADSQEQANERALAEVCADPNEWRWIADDVPCNSDPYIGDPEGAEEIKE